MILLYISENIYKEKIVKNEHVILYLSKYLSFFLCIFLNVCVSHKNLYYLTNNVQLKSQMFTLLCSSLYILLKLH